MLTVRQQREGTTEFAFAGLSNLSTSIAWGQPAPMGWISSGESHRYKQRACDGASRMRMGESHLLSAHVSLRFQEATLTCRDTDEPSARRNISAVRQPREGTTEFAFAGPSIFSPADCLLLPAVAASLPAALMRSDGLAAGYSFLCRVLATLMSKQKTLLRSSI